MTLHPQGMNPSGKRNRRGRGTLWVWLVVVACLFVGVWIAIGRAISPRAARSEVAIPAGSSLPSVTDPGPNRAHSQHAVGSNRVAPAGPEPANELEIALIHESSPGPVGGTARVLRTSSIDGRRRLILGSPFPDRFDMVDMGEFTAAPGLPIRVPIELLADAWIYVSAPGLSPRAICPSSADVRASASSRRPMEVRMKSAAALTVLFHDGSLPVTGVELRVVPLFGCGADWVAQQDSLRGSHWQVPVDWRAVSDDAGTARIDGLPVNVRLDLLADRAGASIRVDASPLRLDVAEERVVEVQVSQTIEFRGVAIDPHGVPREGLRLWAFVDTRNVEEMSPSARYLTLSNIRIPPLQLTTVASGEFRFPAQVGQRYWIGPSLARADAVAAEWADVAQSCLVDANAEPFELRLRAACSLAGRVVDSTGRPVAHAQIELAAADVEVRRMAEADSSGQYVVDGLSSGLHLVRVLATQQHPASSPRAIELVEPRTTEDLRVESAVSLDLQLGDGFPEGDQLMQVAVGGLTPGEVAKMRTPVVDGRFSLAQLQPGRHEILATSSSGWIAHASEVWVDESRRGRAVDLQFVEPCAISVAVEGHLVRGRLTARIGPFVFHDVSVLQGDLALIHAPAGQVQLDLFVDGLRVGTASLTAVAGSKCSTTVRAGP